MRPALKLLIFLVLIVLLDTGLFYHSLRRVAGLTGSEENVAIAVSGLGLTDLCISTEARYTRHPSVSDPMAPFMDHPGSIEHFPTGSFWSPVRQYEQGFFLKTDK